jgi:hypothetical protein
MHVLHPFYDDESVQSMACRCQVSLLAFLPECCCLYKNQLGIVSTVHSFCLPESAADSSAVALSIAPGWRFERAAHTCHVWQLVRPAGSGTVTNV